MGPFGLVSMLCVISLWTLIACHGQQVRKLIMNQMSPFFGMETEKLPSPLYLLQRLTYTRSRKQEQRQISDITLYLNELTEHQGPCFCDFGMTCRDSLLLRCTKEQQEDAVWIYENGGFAGIPFGGNLTLEQTQQVFAGANFGPCEVIEQRPIGGAKLYSAWRRTYVCLGITYTGIEEVEVVFDRGLNQTTWNWITTEPLDSGLLACLESLV